MTILEKTLQTAGEARPTIGVNDDDIQAGWYATSPASHGAGGFRSFPPGVNAGYTRWFSSNNAGAFVITHSNVSFGQSTDFLTPDPANANAVHLVAAGATPFVDGNLIKASGTSGLMIDSGIPSSNYQPLTASVTLNAAQIIAAYATPEVLIPAQAGKVAVIIAATVYTASTGQTPFATGIAPIIQYDTTIHGAGTIAVGAGLVTGDITAAANQVRTIGQAASAVYTGLTNKPVTFSCTTAYTGGTGTTVTFVLQYLLLNATI